MPLQIKIAGSLRRADIFMLDPWKGQAPYLKARVGGRRGTGISHHHHQFIQTWLLDGSKRCLMKYISAFWSHNERKQRITGVSSIQSLLEEDEILEVWGNERQLARQPCEQEGTRGCVCHPQTLLIQDGTSLAPRIAEPPTPVARTWRHQPRSPRRLGGDHRGGAACHTHTPSPPH